jgi:hypothetical protein
MTKEDALAKIRKLLETSGRTHAEVDTAQILAAAIAEKHGIDIADVDRAEDECRQVITHKAMDTWSDVPIEAHCATLICKSHFEISAITVVHRVPYFGDKVETLNFVGTEHHLVIATHVYDFLVREFRWQWRHRRGRCKKRKQFIWGCFCSLADKLEKRFARPSLSGANELEISWTARRQKYIDEVFGKTKSTSVAPKEKGGAAMWRGVQAGKDIELNPAVNGSNARTREALPPVPGNLLTL